MYLTFKERVPVVKPNGDIVWQFGWVSKAALNAVQQLEHVMGNNKAFVVVAFGTSSNSNLNPKGVLPLSQSNVDPSTGKLFTKEEAKAFAKKKAGSGELERNGYKDVEWHVMQSSSISRIKLQPVETVEISCE